MIQGEGSLWQVARPPTLLQAPAKNESCTQVPTNDTLAELSPNVEGHFRSNAPASEQCRESRIIIGFHGIDLKMRRRASVACAKKTLWGVPALTDPQDG